MTVKRVTFFLGWFLLLAAFAAGAAETVVIANPGRGPGMVSAHDLWYTIWPGNRVITQIRVENLSPALWADVIRPLLNLPAWVLTGVPGAVLAWTCRPVKQLTPDEEQDLRERHESMFLYDELAEQAKADGYDDDGDDDMEPDHGLHHLLEDDGVTAPDGEDDFDIDMDGMPPPPGGGDNR